MRSEPSESGRQRTNSSGGRPSAAWLLLFIVAGSAHIPAQGQDLLINEVIASNGEIDPTDIGGRTPDLIEIYNASTETVVLGKATDAQSFYLSDTLTFCGDQSCCVAGDQDCLGVNRAWRFPDDPKAPIRTLIEPGGSIIVFCDADGVEGDCELHAGFRISRDGREPITLWGPVDPVNGERPVVDRVWLPPLGRNVSFGRFPDGAGGPRLSPEETLDHFVFHRLGTPAFPSTSEPTFGSCQVAPGSPCVLGSVRTCTGAANGSGVNLEPRVTRVDHSTNSPEVGEAVEFTVRVRDDKEPTPGNIAKVGLRYRVDEGNGFGAVQTVEMRYDSVTGIRPVIPAGEPCDPEQEPGCDFPEQPLDRWSLWTGSIAGQSVAGARVEFHFTVEDREGLSSTSPGPLCEELPDIEPGMEIRGPCDRQFGGQFTGEVNCRRDLKDVTCRDVEGAKPVRGERFVACDAWLTYTVGYEPTEGLEHLVINEIVPLQERLLADPHERECVPDDLCPPSIPDCCKREDFIELHNTSDQAIDLAGLRLSDRWFRPRRGWQFPAGSKIGPGEYLIVWTDNDGGKCPDDRRGDPPCFWECPDPTDPAVQSYHTNFNLGFARDQIFLFDRAERGFGVIHGVDFSLQVEDVDKSLSLLPDGDRQGCFVLVDAPTPGRANVGEPGPDDCPGLEGARFIRGDSAGNCGVDLSDVVRTLNWLFLGGPQPECLDAADVDDNGVVDLTDAIRTLNWLFLGGREPEAPGPVVAGPDPTDDDLEECVYPDRCL